MTPLSHHEILRHVGPFAKASRHVDLAHSDRAARILVFKPVVHPAASLDTTGQLSERLTLDLSRSTPTLRRTVTNADGLQSTLSTRGTDLEVLLEQVLAVPVETHFRNNFAIPIADSYRCPDNPAKPLILRESRAHVQGFEVVIDARNVIAEPMWVTLTPLDEAKYELPDDLAAVLGHSWTVLRNREDHWTFKVRVPGREPKRSKVALARFERTITHLDQVLGNAPAAFHEVHRSARWQVWLRLLMPVITIVVLLSSLPLLDRYVLDEDTVFPTLALGLPNVLILAFLYFSRHEIPSIGIPPRPRGLAPDAWVPKTSRDATHSKTLPENPVHD